MEFSQHRSNKLVELFTKKPYQGQSPEQAKIIFLSSDANYSHEISEHPFFNKILEYHSNGVEFWKKNRVHHPFLLNDYPFKKNQGGVTFHKRFSAIGLNSTYAHQICFLELLDVPTIGSMSKNKNLFLSLINPNYLQYIDSILKSDSGKVIFISKNIVDLIHLVKKKYQIFDWADDSLKKVGDTKQLKSNKIMVIYHFSASVSIEYRKSLKEIIDNIIFC